MPVFTTRWGNPILRILGTYPVGSPGLPIAIEELIKTACSRVQQENKDQLAADTCLGTLHEDAAAGIICRKCFDAMEKGKVPPPVDSTPPDQKLSESEEEERASVARMVANLVDEE